MAVVEQLERAVADFADDVAHLVEPDFIKAELAHFGFSALANCTNLAVITGNGAEVAQKFDDVFALCFDALLDGVDDFLVGHVGLAFLKGKIDKVVVRFELAAFEDDNARIGILDAADLLVQHHTAPA